MDSRIRSLTGLWLAACLIFAAPVLAADAEGNFERTLNVTGAVELHVQTGSGSITVKSGPGSSVRIFATIKARDSRERGLSSQEVVRRLQQNPPIEQNGNVIRIGRLEDRELQRNVSISYEISTPAETQLSAHTGSGSQSVEGVRGRLDLTTGSGSITVAKAGGDLKASTGSGAIHATAIGGAAKLSTGSGSIHLQLATGGDVHASTGSGSIDIRGAHGVLHASTGSGAISADGKPTGNWHIQTASGGIRVRLPAETGFELTAKTSSGRIYVDHPVVVQGAIGPREVQGKVRGGGPLLKLSTASGNIRIE